MKENIKTRAVNLWKSFTLYEKIWFFTVVIATIVVAVLFPSTNDDGIDLNIPFLMFLYVGDVLTNVLCELLISKQSKWNFIVSLFVEFFEIAIALYIKERFATMAVTIVFWIPVDIISFFNWNHHLDKQEEDLTVVRKLTWWQDILVILGIIIWTPAVGFLLTLIEEEGILPSGSTEEIVVCYLDAAASAVGICNGLFILFRYREQWIAWYIVSILEIIMNIIMGAWVLIVLKVAYLSNTTYGYIKWTQYIKAKNNDNQQKTLEK